MGKKCIDFSSDKPAKFHTIKLRLNKERETLISSNSWTEQRHKVYLKAIIDKTQQNSRCKLCGEGDETINHLISECSKLAPKETQLGGQGDPLGIV